MSDFTRDQDNLVLLESMHKNTEERVSNAMVTRLKNYSYTFSEYIYQKKKYSYGFHLKHPITMSRYFNDYR